MCCYAVDRSYLDLGTFDRDLWDSFISESQRFEFTFIKGLLMLLISGTWLTEAVPDEFMSLDRYNIF